MRQEFETLKTYSKKILLITTYLNCYLSDFGVLASSNNDTNASTRSNVSSREKKVGLVLVDSSEIVDNFGLLLNRNGFTSQEGLVDSHGGRVDLEDSDISGDLVTDGDFDDITGDDFSGEDSLDLFSIGSEDLAHLGLVLLQGFDGGLGVLFLPDTDDGVGDEDEEDDKGLDKGSDSLVVVFEEGEDKGDAGSEEEDSNEQVFELLDNEFHEGFAFFGGEFVEAISFLVVGDLEKKVNKKPRSFSGLFY